MVYILHCVMDLGMYSVTDTSVYPHSAYRNSGMVFQMLSSMFIVTLWR